MDKKCGTCKKLKSLSAFYKNAAMSDGLQHRCIECIRNYKKSNKAKINDSNRKSYYTNRDKRLAYGRKSDVKQKGMLRSRAYRKNNPEIINSLSAKRKASKLQRTPNWLKSNDFNNIRLFYKAATLLTKEFGVKMVVDHIIPLQGKNVSGLHVPWNLQVITEKENASKGNKFG